MTPRTYYRLSLGLPLMVPLAAIAILAVYGVSGAPDPPREVGLTLFFLAGSLFVGGLPYAMVAVSLAIAMERWSLTTIRIVSFVTPAVFAVIAGLLGAAMLPRGAAMFAGCAIAFGYAYVLLAHTGYAVLRSLGVIEAPSDGGYRSGIDRGPVTAPATASKPPRRLRPR